MLPTGTKLVHLGRQLGHLGRQLGHLGRRLGHLGRQPGHHGLNCVTKETRLLLSFFLSPFSFEGVPVGVPGAIFKRLGSIEVFFVKVLASAMIQSLRHLSQLCVWLYLTSYSQTFVPYVPIRSSFQK